MTKRRIFTALISLLISLFAVQVALAQSGVTDDEVNHIASQLFCPTCEAIPVDVCPTEVCSDWRAEIRSQLESGRSEREILDYFADRYGSGVLANPPPRGIGLFVWIAPVAIAVLGLAVFGWQMQKLSSQNLVAQTETNTTPIPQDPSLAVESSTPDIQIDGDEYRRRLEEELK